MRAVTGTDDHRIEGVPRALRREEGPVLAAVGGVDHLQEAGVGAEDDAHVLVVLVR